MSGVVTPTPSRSAHMTSERVSAGVREGVMSYQGCTTHM